MNGRIYDANIGRFLQADPFVQFPNLTQSHNRYSYVLNNPLTYNDPSGYFLKKLMKVTGLTSILKAIASIPILDAAVSIVIGIYAPWALPLYQGLKTYAVTGSFGAALKSFAISYATIGVSQYIGANLNFDLGGWTAVQNVASHAMVGGVSAVLQGGKFGHGFVSSLVTASMKGFMNPKTTEFGNAYSRTAIAGVVGGTVSKLTGGKFANGAVTSAMQWWYNAEGRGRVKQKVDYEKIWKDMKRTWSDYWKGSNQELAPLAVAAENAASIAYNNPSKTLAAGGSVIGGAVACLTVKGCILGGPLVAYGVDQTHALVNGNNMTTSQQYLGDVLSHPDARAAFPFIENPHNAAGTIIDISTFAAGGAGVSTLNLYNGTGNTMDVINAINDTNTLKNY